MSPDPLAVHAPGKADLNLYAYVSGQVLKAIDPLGLCPNTGAGGCGPVNEGGASGPGNTPEPEAGEAKSSYQAPAMVVKVDATRAVPAPAPKSVRPARQRSESTPPATPVVGLAPLSEAATERLLLQAPEIGAASGAASLGWVGLGLLAQSDTPLPEPTGTGTGEGEPRQRDLIIYRGMRDAGGMPQVGPGARSLGVRAGDVPNSDIALTPQGMVMPGTGGMSVAPLSPFNLRPHRRPPGFGGTGPDPVWALKVQDLGPQLKLDIDSPTHGTVQPATMMDIRAYERALGETAPRWRGPYWSPADVKF